MAGVSAYAANGASCWHRFPAAARRLRGAVAAADDKIEIYIYKEVHHFPSYFRHAKSDVFTLQ
jgi:hypothetical protein